VHDGFRAEDVRIAGQSQEQLIPALSISSSSAKSLADKCTTKISTVMEEQTFASSKAMAQFCKKMGKHTI
jgi:hypothetical protein